MFTSSVIHHWGWALRVRSGHKTTKYRQNQNSPVAACWILMTSVWGYITIICYSRIPILLLKLYFESVQQRSDANSSDVYVRWRTSHTEHNIHTTIYEKILTCAPVGCHATSLWVYPLYTCTAKSYLVITRVHVYTVSNVMQLVLYMYPCSR